MTQNDSFMIAVAVDVVLLRLNPCNIKNVQVALIKRSSAPFINMLALPGGTVNKNIDASLDETARRIVKEKTPITSIFLEQCATVGNAQRDPRGFSISVVYFALLDVEQAKVLDEQENPFIWHDLKKIQEIESKIAFDHAQIIALAAERVKNKSCYSSLPVHLMPECFTLTQLQSVYEAILDSKIDKRSFRRKIEQFNVLSEDENIHAGAHRPAQLYRCAPEFHNKIAISNKNFETI